MKVKEERVRAPIVGFDIGGTITQATFGSNVKEPWPESFRVIKRILLEISPLAYIVSRVNEEQKTRAINWLYDNDVYAKTGLLKDNVFWCKERHEKGPIVQTLGITHFIDDRPEVMKYLPLDTVKIMINPDPVHLYEHCNLLRNYTVCKDWLEIEKFMFDKRRP